MNISSPLSHAAIKPAMEPSVPLQAITKSTPSLGLSSMQILYTIRFFVQLYEYFESTFDTVNFNSIVHFIQQADYRLELPTMGMH